MTEPNQKRLSLAALLEEDAAPTNPRICYELECGTFAQPGDEYCAEHEVQASKSNGHAKRINPNDVEDEDNPVPKRTKCMFCKTNPLRNSTSDYCQPCWDKRQREKKEKRGKDALGIPISNERRMEQVKAKAKALSEGDQIRAEMLDKAIEEVQPKNGEYVMVKRENDDGGKSYIVGIKLSDVKSRRMKWVWEGRIPQGKGVILQGHGQRQEHGRSGHIGADHHRARLAGRSEERGTRGCPLVRRK